MSSGGLSRACDPYRRRPPGRRSESRTRAGAARARRAAAPPLRLPPIPAADAAPGGPILVVTATGNKFTRYLAEILQAEGLNAYATADVSALDATLLADYKVVVLGETALTAGQVTDLTGWVDAGGNLIAMRPDAQLFGLLGVTSTGGNRNDQYLKLTASPAGAGIVTDSIQYHGTATRYTLAGATAVATLYTTPTNPTPNPAVTLRSVGSAGGEAAAFAFDLARSVVYTRQGRPGWAGQERDGIAPIRPDDLFFGAKASNPQPDWVDLNKVAIPQADEQQRLLANLITRMARDVMPLPRFWYFPRDEKAVIVMTGDDHASGGTAGRFDSQAAQSPPGCSVADWECIRSTSYIYTNTPLTNAQATAYDAQGFEVALARGRRTAATGRRRSSRASSRRSWPTGRPSTRACRRRSRTARTASPGATGPRIRRPSWPTASASTRTTTTGRRTGSRTGPACSPARACRCASPTSTAP